MGERKGAMVLLGIITIAALGLSGYMFVKNEILSTPGATSPDSGLTLVGLWDDLAKNKDYPPYDSDDTWRIEFDNNQYNDSNYISVSESNTSFKLLKEGFYKLTILVYANELDPGGTYWFYLYRNNSVNHCLVKIEHPTLSHYQVESSVYLKSTGLDNFFIRAYSTGDISFAISTTQSFNQLSIEYNQ